MFPECRPLQHAAARGSTQPPVAARQPADCNCSSGSLSTVKEHFGKRLLTLGWRSLADARQTQLTAVAERRTLARRLRGNDANNMPHRNTLQHAAAVERAPLSLPPRGGTFCRHSHRAAMPRRLILFVFAALVACASCASAQPFDAPLPSGVRVCTFTYPPFVVLGTWAGRPLEEVVRLSNSLPGFSAQPGFSGLVYTGVTLA